MTQIPYLQALALLASTEGSQGHEGAEYVTRTDNIPDGITQAGYALIQGSGYTIAHVGPPSQPASSAASSYHQEPLVIARNIFDRESKTPDLAWLSQLDPHKKDYIIGKIAESLGKLSKQFLTTAGVASFISDIDPEGQLKPVQQTITLAPQSPWDSFWLQLQAEIQGEVFPAAERMRDILHSLTPKGATREELRLIKKMVQLLAHFTQKIIDCNDPVIRHHYEEAQRLYGINDKKVKRYMLWEAWKGMKDPATNKDTFLDPTGEFYPYWLYLKNETTFNQLFVVYDLTP